MRDDIEETNSLTFDPLGSTLWRVVNDLAAKRRRKREAATLLGPKRFGDLNQTAHHEKNDESQRDRVIAGEIPKLHGSLQRLIPMGIASDTSGPANADGDQQKQDCERMIADESHADQPREREGVTRLRRPGS